MEGSDVNLPAVSWANITALYQLLSTYPDPPLSHTPSLYLSPSTSHQTWHHALLTICTHTLRSQVYGLTLSEFGTDTGQEL